MQASSSDSEDREGGRKRTRMDNVKVSVSDLASDDFKKVWLSLKAVHDKELHRLQVKLSNMRKARLTQGRRLVSKGNRSLTQPTEASNTKECERCLVNEAYRAVLHQEFNNMQQKNLVQIAELTVENNKLKEENKMLSEKLKATPRVQFNFTDSDYEDFVKGTQMKIKHMYTVKAPPQAVQISSSPRHVTKPHNEPKKHPCTLMVEPPPPNKPVLQGSQEIQVVSETSFVDSPSVEDHGTKEANILLSCTAHSVKAALATSRKDESNTFSKPPEVKLKASTQKCGKSTFIWNFPSTSSGEPVIVSETSEESMPCNPNSALAAFEKRRQRSTNTTQVFPIDYTSKYVQKRRSPKFGSSHSAVSIGPLLSRGETTGKSICESENTKKIAKRPRSDSDRVHSESMLKKKDN